MTRAAWIQAIVLFALVAACVKPLGLYIARVFAGEPTVLSPVLVPLERGIYRVARIRADQQMCWPSYLFAMLAFSLTGIAALYALLRTQQFLPFNRSTGKSSSLARWGCRSRTRSSAG